MRRTLKFPAWRHGNSLFMSDRLRQELIGKSAVLQARMLADDPRAEELPRTLRNQSYTNVWPLPAESDAGDSSPPNFLYKVTSTVDGYCYLIKRFSSCPVPEKYAQKALMPWLELLDADSARDGQLRAHGSIVGLRDVFSTGDFGDNSLCFVYDFHPGAITLKSKYFGSMGPSPVYEDTLWGYICQLLTGMTAIHSAGLAIRDLSARRVLLTGRNRVRLSCCGLIDALQGPNKSIQQLQAQDVHDLGLLILSLGCGSPLAAQNLAQSLDYLSTQFTQDLVGFVGFLLSGPKSPGVYTTVFEASQLITHRLLNHVGHAHTHMDFLDTQLARECQNGRLLRLLVKLGFVNERPGLDETGDRYLLKLFRDFVFHQVKDDGSPDLDFGHVVGILNKLDVGSEEKAVLSSRDHETLLVTR